MFHNAQEINAARPQYEERMLNNAHSPIRSTQPEIPQRVAFNFLVRCSVLPLQFIKGDTVRFSFFYFLSVGKSLNHFF